MPDRPISLPDRERLCDALLKHSSLRSSHLRDLCVSDLQQRCDHLLSIQRHAEARRDLWSIIGACQYHPAALPGLLDFIRSVDGVGPSVTLLERMVATEPRPAELVTVPAVPPVAATVLATHQRDALCDHLAGVTAHALSTTYAEVYSHPVADRDGLWTDAGAVVALVESARPDDPLPLILTYADRLAHRLGGPRALDLHKWVDEVGTDHGLAQEWLRQICASDGHPPDPVFISPISSENEQGRSKDARSSISDPGALVIPAPVVPPAILDQPDSVRIIWGGVPIRNPDFTGRQLLLQLLRDALRTQSKASVLPQALHGYGGVGKTQLATEYVYQYASEYQLVWWMSAEDPVQVRASLATLGERLGLPRGQDIQQTASTVLDALAASPLRWLMVYDNAIEPADIQPLLPSAGGHVIITSRNQTWATVGTGNPIEVDVFDREESIELLRKRGEIPAGEANQLAEKVGDLPLALDQVATWRSATGMSATEYLGLFDSHVQELMAEGKPPQYPTTVSVFVRVAVDRLNDVFPAAAELMEMFAYLGPDALSTRLLQLGRNGELSPDLSRALADPLAMRRAIQRLREYGLAKVDPGGQNIHVHRLVQLVLRDDMKGERRDRSRTNVQQILASANPRFPRDLRHADVYKEIGPHVRAADLVNADSVGARRAVMDQATYLDQTGDYEGARDLAEAALVAWSKPVEEGGLGPDNEFTLLATRRLGVSLLALGLYPRAEELLRTAYEGFRRHPDFGEDHDHTMRARDAVGRILRTVGRFEEARESDEDNLRRSRATNGDDDEFTLQVKNNTAVNYRMLGDFEQARRIDEAIVVQWEQNLGKNDVRTLFSISNLARDLYGLGQYAEALELQRQALPLAIERQGPRHNYVLLAARTVGICLRKLGRYDEALKQARENYLNYHGRFGADHEHTLAATVSYANCLRVVGKSAEAYSLAADAVDRYGSLFGDQHPLTLSARVNLAIILRATGEYRRAYQLDSETASAMREVLGDEHAYTLCALTGLASDLVLQHRLPEACELSQKTLTASRSSRGDDHPYTLACAINAAFDMQAVGEKATGQDLFDRTMARLRQIRGKDHPEVLDANRGKRAECDLEPSPM